MQRTRLSTLLDSIGGQFNLWLVNPWRKLSILIISLLLGKSFGVVVTAFAGQAAQQDVFVSAVLVLTAEIISRLVYGYRVANPDSTVSSRPFIYDMLNLFKIGTMYALAVEAFKLGS